VALCVGLLIAAVVAPEARAGDVIRLYGEENVGTAAGQFLKIPVGARAVGLGKAYVACATDGPTLFWNPAGVMRTPGRSNFFLSHTAYTADIQLHYASFHKRGQNYGWGITAGMLRSGAIERTTEFHAEGTGQYFDANQYVLGLTLARAMTDRFSVGGSVKYYQENLDEWATRALLLDLGILYFVGVGDLRIGFAVKNFGGDLQPSGEPPLREGYPVQADFQGFPAPTEGSFGVAYTWTLAPWMSLLTTTDFHHPSDYQEAFRMGAEFGLGRMLYLRGGYETGRHEGGLAAGFGLKIARKQFQWSIDYGYSDLGSFGELHHISIEFSPLKPREPVDTSRLPPARRER